jgi:hypothetical protein
MVKEPNEISAARASLKKSAEDFGDPGRLGHLRNGISSLAEVLAGESAQIQKDISKKLALTYRNKLLSEVKVVVANMDSYDPESLGHWHQAMEAFVDAGFGDDPEFNALREQLFTQLGAGLVDRVAPMDLDILKKELEATLNSLATHKSRLGAGIKWQIEK